LFSTEIRCLGLDTRCAPDRPFGSNPGRPETQTAFVTSGGPSDEDEEGFLAFFSLLSPLAFFTGKKFYISADSAIFYLTQHIRGLKSFASSSCASFFDGALVFFAFSDTKQ
jgi:hypothetical protein